MSRISVGELVKRAKGEDRSLREYARDSGVDPAILSKVINGNYIPKKPGIYEALTNPKASPRGGVTCEQLLAAAGASEDYQNGMSAGMSVGMLAALSDIPSSDMIKVLQARGVTVSGHGRPEGTSSSMKAEEIRRIRLIQSDIQQYTAIANGIILGSLGKKGLTFQLVHTDEAEVDHISFDTCVRLMNHEVSEYLIRYAFFSDEAAVSEPLAINTIRRMIEELVFLKPLRTRIVSVVTNHPGAYEALCAGKDQISYNGELSWALFDPGKAALLKEDYLSHYLVGEPVSEIHLL